MNVCELCGKPSKHRKVYKHFYCSVDCAKKAQDKKVTWCCVVCHKLFNISPSRVNRIKTCSVKCGGIFRRKGENGKYATKHYWAVVKWGKANHCDQCGLNKIPKGMKRYFEWSNKDHMYRPGRANWQQLCILCHRRFDKKFRK